MNPDNNPQMPAQEPAPIQPSPPAPAELTPIPIPNPSPAPIPIQTLAPAPTTMPEPQVIQPTMGASMDPNTPTPVNPINNPQNFSQPVMPAEPPAQPQAPGGIFVGGDTAAPVMSSPSTPHGPAGLPKFSSGSKKPLLFSLLAALIIIGAPLYYFGYYMNSNVIYSQSLKNSGKASDKLIDYLDKESQANHKSYEGSGTFKINSSSYKTDGSMSVKGDADNSEFKFDIGTGTGRVNADVRSLKSIGTSPDIYFKASGLKGLGSTYGIPELDTSIKGIDDQWVVIDHTLFDNLAGASPSKKMALPTHAQVMDAIHAMSKVNQDYVFSTKKDKAVFHVDKKYGVEKVDGHKAYHYKISIVKDNVKSYVNAEHDALNKSSLDKWIKDNNYQKDVDSFFKDMADSTKSIKASDTFELWSDVSHRIVYKTRFPDAKNPANNYSEIGLDFKGGSNYPFFIKGKSDDGKTTTTGFLKMSLDTKTKVVAFSFNLKATGSDAYTAEGNFKTKSSNAAIKIEKPTGAKQLSEVLNALGLGDLLTGLGDTGASTGSINGGVQDKARNTKRQTDIQSLQTQLEAFFSQNGYYPSLTDMNSVSWRTTNMKSLDPGALIDPSSTSSSTSLLTSPAAKAYSYAVTDSAGASCESADTNCAKYTLTAIYEGSVNGATTYNKSNLD